MFNFHKLKELLTTPRILTLLVEGDDFIVYCNTSNVRLGFVLIRMDCMIAYASRKLKVHEFNYTALDLKLVVVAFVLKIRKH